MAIPDRYSRWLGPVELIALLGGGDLPEFIDMLTKFVGVPTAVCGPPALEAGRKSQALDRDLPCRVRFRVVDLRQQAAMECRLEVIEEDR